MTLDLSSNELPHNSNIEDATKLLAGQEAVNPMYERISEVIPQLTSMNLEIQAIHELIDNRLRYDAAKERMFDLLYAKMQEQDGSFQISLKKNLVLALLRFYDHMLQVESELAGVPEAKAKLQNLCQELLDVLYAEEVEIIEPVGNSFDPKLQQATRVIMTDKMEEDRTIIQVIRQGFTLSGKVLRPQAVAVMKYQS